MPEETVFVLTYQMDSGLKLLGGVFSSKKAAVTAILKRTTTITKYAEITEHKMDVGSNIFPGWTFEHDGEVWYEKVRIS